MPIAPEIIGSIVGAGSGLLNTGLNALNMGAQTKAAKELMDYQWKNFQSPKAQVAAMGAAGLNAGALFGDGKGNFASPSVAMPSSVPVQIDGVASMANYLTAVSNAKKAGVETSNLEVERQAKQFELELSKFFAAPAKVAEITLAWKNVMLANDEHSIKEWQKVKEEMLAGLTGVQKQAAQKQFENMDTVIDQQNRQREEDINLTKEKQKTEGTQQIANRASANASNASAELSRQQAKTEDDLREVRKFAIDLGNHLQGLEYGFNLDTYQARLNKFASEVGIAKWTSYLSEIEAKDRAAYNAVQRVIMGKGTKEDGKTLWKFINDGRQLIPFD